MNSPRRRRPQLRRARQPSPLTIDQLHELVTRFASTRPLTTSEITEICQSRHPDYGITTERVTQLLKWLARRGRVRSWSGADTAELEQLGVVEPLLRARYWAPVPQDATHEPEGGVTALG